MRRGLLFLLLLTTCSFILNIYTISVIGRESDSLTAVSFQKSQHGGTLFRKYGYRTIQEMLDRDKRFPSIDDRVKLYMSNWYLPPCNDTDQVAYEYLGNNYLLLQEPGNRTFQLDSSFNGNKVKGSFDHVHFMDLKTMSNCSDDYCVDMVNFIVPGLDRTQIGSTPIVFQFGDSWKIRGFRVDLNRHGFPLLGLQLQFPVIGKIRKSLSNGGLEELTSDQCMDRHKNHWHQVIVKLKVKRHFGKIRHVSDEDLPWEEKVDVAIFRGALTGNHDNIGMPRSQIRDMTELERCFLLPRCWISLVYHNATLVDAKLTQFSVYKDIYMLPPVIKYKSEWISLNGTNMSLKDILKYKGLIMLEGNDVSSGLKWALYSNSVVLMPKPVYTSWAMEELLQPWVHYIPIDPLSSTDIEDKMRWILDHDKEAQQIAQNGRLWISDLVLHPMVRQEEEAIFDEILRRYALHFRPASQLFRNAHHERFG